MRVQRYCVKNDTIGFFGPHGWARFDERAGRIEVRPGAGLTASREVFFEDWAIQMLAECLESKHAIRGWVAPRIKAGVWIQGSRAHRPLRKALALSEAELAVLALCDGVRTAKEVAQAVLARGVPGWPGDEQGVFGMLERLAGADIVAWRLEVAPQTYPERELRARLARIGEAALRERCMSAVDELVEAREGVAAAAGRAEELDVALAELERCFTRLTEQPASRLGGKTYAARTLVYEDCRRDGEVRIGPSLLAELAQPLGVVLDAMRWVAAELGRVLRGHLRVCLAELGVREGDEIDCHQFVSYVVSTVWMQGRSALFEPTLERFRQKWESVLGRALELSPSRAAFSLEEVRGRADEAFAARDTGWALARYLSPDLLIAAADADAVRRGDYRAVLGELHAGNTLASFVAQHPDARELLEAAAEDTRDEMVVFRSFPRPVWVARTNNDLVAPQHLRYLFGDDPPCHPPCRELPAGKLVVVDTGSSVVAQARDGSLRFDALELFGNSLLDDATRLMGEFRPALPHVPRVTLGRLTIARERWNVTPAEMPFRRSADPAQQFLELRAWGRDHGMPRRVFVKCPSERKPWFLDFDSPAYAEIFSSTMRRLPDGAGVTIVEMLPDLHDLWFLDRQGQRFTCELRCVARRLG